MTSTVSEVTLPRDAVIDAATLLIAWDRRIRDLTIDVADEFGDEDAAEAGMQLLSAVIRSEYPDLDERERETHRERLVESVWDRAYEETEVDALIVEVVSEHTDAIAEHVADRVAKLVTAFAPIHTTLDRIEKTLR